MFRWCVGYPCIQSARLSFVSEFYQNPSVNWDVLLANSQFSIAAFVKHLDAFVAEGLKPPVRQIRLLLFLFNTVRVRLLAVFCYRVFTPYADAV